jgi:UDP-2,3-diacylglucosamine pyrophosphatase LpxH
MKKRSLDLLVLSDVHLGTYGCHAEELCNYLDTIDPRRIILNGDIIDIWNFKKSYWPQAHHEVLERLLAFLSQGVEIFYLTGNHDEMLRRFSGFQLGTFHILDKLILDIGGKKTWIFHGDVFDMSMQHSKWIAKLGGYGYDLLIVLNRFINAGLRMVGREPYSFSKAVKNGVKKAVSFMGSFETTVASIAADKGYEAVILGHIHNPVIKQIQAGARKVQYLNSGDWIENLTSLEFSAGRWSLFYYRKTTMTIPREKPTATLHPALLHEVLSAS